MRIAASAGLHCHREGKNWSKELLLVPAKSVTFARHSTKAYGLTSLTQIQGLHMDDTISIDEIPYPHLRSSIHHILHRLPPGATVSFQCTTLAPDIAYLSDNFVICAVPFLPRMFPGVPSNEDRARTSTPLLAPLHHIINCLLSASSAVKIESVMNIAQAHADTLYSKINERTTIPGCRQACIDNYGLEGWREQQFLMAWEAGLLVERHLTRWHVVVQKA